MEGCGKLIPVQRLSRYQLGKLVEIGAALLSEIRLGRRFEAKAKCNVFNGIESQDESK